MASLDVNASLMEAKGEELIRRWEENLNQFYREAAEFRISDYAASHAGSYQDQSGYEPAGGIDGAELEQLAYEKGDFR